MKNGVEVAGERGLARILRGSGRMLVAYSGGVDSAYLLWRSYQEVGDRVLGVLADSPSLARSERAEAIEFAADHRLPLRVIGTEEMENPAYRANPPNRCFFCKAELFARMERLAAVEGFDTLAYGENADDVAAERPGSGAARAFAVRAPLREAGLGKVAVRQLAAAAGLRVAEKVASPCLASRIPHGQEVTVEKLARVEAAEAWVRARGFAVVRVRHDGKIARLQVAPAEVDRLCQEEAEVRAAVLALGFEGVEIDRNGYRGAGLR
ncbi:MAG: ATP-dependent sacrificial sulfur transferase LarE [Verrucomicrobiia bacterium]